MPGSPNFGRGTCATSVVLTCSAIRRTLTARCANTPLRTRVYRRAGFALLATLAVGDKRASDDDFRAFLPLIERGAEDSRVRIGKSRELGPAADRQTQPGALPDALALARRLAAKEGRQPRRIGRDAVRELTLERIIARIK